MTYLSRAEARILRLSVPRYLCIHGHFYQPPRENPWLDIIERQPSARPCHDWNERVTEECYAPNAWARVLNAEGKIERIINNYARISFNVGPTLLSWMERRRPELYAAVVEADRESRERFDGHGSAIAQVYNHMILPLANARDRRTQVRWGLRDFQRRFGRDPEGMWLAETAVDVASLEDLAEAGIRYTILAPRQAARVRPEGHKGWLDVRGGKVDPRRAYRVRLPSGRSIAAFFYDGPVSQAVAFERLLDDGKRLLGRLLGVFGEGEDQLSHIATDGETYGHHHRFGEMALAYALSTLERLPAVQLTNYGQYLERCPPRWEAEIVENSSWSCVHGIERWRGDCGCSTGWRGDFNQRWRAPLREALDGLRDALAPRFEAEGQGLFRDPWEARDAYIDVVLERDERTIDRFLRAHLRPERELEDAATRERALTLMEMQRHAMLMYTSCGWFFDELSGIETVQVMAYAARALELGTHLFGDRFEPAFRERLGHAKSNLEEQRDGAYLYDRRVRTGRVGSTELGACVAIGSALRDEEVIEPLRYAFAYETRESHRTQAGSSFASVERVLLRSRLTGHREELELAAAYWGAQHFVCGVRAAQDEEAFRAMREDFLGSSEAGDALAVLRVLERHFGPERVRALSQLQREVRERITDKLVREQAERIDSTLARAFQESAPLMRWARGLEASWTLPLAYRLLRTRSLHARLLRELGSAEALDLRAVHSLLGAIEGDGSVPEPRDCGGAASASMKALVLALEKEPRRPLLWERAIGLARLLGNQGWPSELAHAQTAFFRFAARYRERWLRAAAEGDGEAEARAGRLRELADALGIHVPATL